MLKITTGEAVGITCKLHFKNKTSTSGCFTTATYLFSKRKITSSLQANAFTKNTFYASETVFCYAILENRNNDSHQNFPLLVIICKDLLILPALLLKWAQNTKSNMFSGKYLSFNTAAPAYTKVNA